MILVTGAGGKTGKAVIQALLAKGQAVRAFVRRAGPIGAAEIVVGDMRDELALRQALQGVAAVYHICPNVNSEEAVIGHWVISAAREVGVARFVFHSVLHPQAEAMPHHWSKLRVEEKLFESGLTFTILQPTAYLQNLLGGWGRMLETGRLLSPYPVETRISLVDLDEVAEVAAQVLTETGHAGATYELVGTPPLSQIEVAAGLSQALGRAIRAEAQTIADWESNARAGGMGEYERATLIKMFQYYERFGLIGNPQVLRWLLGRKPKGVEAWARRVRWDRSSPSPQPFPAGGGGG